MIDIGLLMRFGAKTTLHLPNEVIFNPNGHDGFLYQVVAGAVKLITRNHEGHEFVHRIYGDGQCFGVLMPEFQAASSAIALETTSLIRLPNERFSELLREHGRFAEMGYLNAKRLQGGDG
ncbi:MAG: Crp/Fnr family transcriptional regulator [Cyclobacteriaceae bacterium]